MRQRSRRHNRASTRNSFRSAILDKDRLSAMRQDRVGSAAHEATYPAFHYTSHPLPDMDVFRLLLRSCDGQRSDSRSQAARRRETRKPQQKQGTYPTVKTSVQSHEPTALSRSQEAGPQGASSRSLQRLARRPPHFHCSGFDGRLSDFPWRSLHPSAGCQPLLFSGLCFRSRNERNHFINPY